MVFSFDIFDTTLTRSLARPTDVFLLMQGAMKGAQNLDIPQDFCLKFSHFRKTAEKKARHASENEDVTLGQIYNCLEEICGLSHESTRRIMDIEMQMEQKVIHPISPVVRHINHLIASGERVFFLSDMYLPADFLRPLLNRAGLPVDDVPIYMSGEIGLRKLTGRLYRHVLDKENIQPSELMHFGDNLFSDVFVPNRIGINIAVRNELGRPLNLLLTRAGSFSCRS